MGTAPEGTWFGIGSHPCERCGHRLLHHFAQMSGHGELLATSHAARLDKDDVATHGCPDQPNGNSGLLDAFFDFPFGAILRHAKRFVNHLRGHDELIQLAFGNAPRLLAD